MPFVFPKRVLRDGDVLSKAEMNADWQPVGELASGHIDSHNLDSGNLAVNVAVADGAFHKHYYVEEGVNSGFGDNTGYTVPTLASPPTDAWVVPITSNWSTVDGMSISNITTGISKLWIVGWAAYVYYGFSNANNAAGTHACQTAGNSEDAGLQLALRVDGQILSETVTGHTDERYRPHIALKTARQRNSGDADAAKKNLPGPGLPHSNAVRGHGPQAGALRLVAEAPVGPGVHTVELVARVVQPNNPLESLAITTAAVGLHNRKLFVLDCPISPATAPSRTAVEIPAFDDASVVSTTAMTTDRMTVLTTALNDLDEGHVARGAFTGRHLPDVPLDVAYAWITPSGPVKYNCKYPGYNVDSLATTRDMNDVGWTWVQDTTGPKYLRTDSDLVRASGDILTDNADCVVVVMADVQLHQINGRTGERAGQSSTICDFAGFALAYTINNGVDLNVLGNTEAFFNNHIFWASAASADASRPIETSVPLFHVFNFSPQTLPTAGTPYTEDIDYIGVVTSGFSTAQTGGGTINLVPDNYCQRGAITMLMLRG